MKRERTQSVKESRRVSISITQKTGIEYGKGVPMWQNFAQLSLSPLNFVLRATIVYLAVLILLRISGKKQVGQMGAIEFVTILLISNAVQNAMNGGDNSL